jgi:hypothetical protein
MALHELKDKDGRVYAFEIDNLLVSKRRVCKIVRSIPGVRVLFFSREDEFCEFEVDGQKFTVWEPWGDNSHYWVGPQPPQWCEQIALVREAFLQDFLAGGFSK